MPVGVGRGALAILRVARSRSKELLVDRFGWRLLLLSDDCDGALVLPGGFVELLRLHDGCAHARVEIQGTHLDEYGLDHGRECRPERRVVDEEALFTPDRISRRPECGKDDVGHGLRQMSVHAVQPIAEILQGLPHAPHELAIPGLLRKVHEVRAEGPQHLHLGDAEGL